MCHHILVSTRRYAEQSTPVTVGDQDIPQVHSLRLLDVTLQNILKWDLHVNNMVSKANSRKYFLVVLKRRGGGLQDLVKCYRVRRQSGFPTFISCQRQDVNVLPKRRPSHQGDKLCDVSTVPLAARWPVFLARGSDADGEPHCSFVRSILEYAVQVWHPGLTGGHSELLERVQKHVLRSLLPEAKYSEALAATGLATLEQRWVNVNRVAGLPLVSKKAQSSVTTCPPAELSVMVAICGARTN